MTEPLIGSATEQNHPARISVTYLGYEIHCDKCGVLGTSTTQVEALAKGKEHKKMHA